MLSAYALLAASTQLLWLSFAAVDTDAARLMHVDVGTVGDLAAVFPGLYIVLALPTGRWLDSRFTQALSVGAVLVAAGALLRMVAPTAFAWQLAGQVVIAAGQPLVMNSINKIAARNFPESERALAISIGSAALFAGILAAVLTSGPLLAAGGLRLLLYVHGAVGVLAAATVLATVRTKPAFADTAQAGGLAWLRRSRFMWLLAGLVFIGTGTYNAVATFLQPVLSHLGEGGAAGPLIAVMTFAGILGAASVAPAAAARQRRRLMLCAAVVVSALAFAMLAVIHAPVWSGAWLFAAGFLLLAALPVVLDWAEVHAGPGRQGAAVGFVMLAGNLGGLIYVVAVQVVIGSPYVALGLLAAGTVIGLPLALRLPDERVSRAEAAPARGPAPLAAER